ncbi:MAG: sigma-54 interaction domain-containing protein [Bdellovibrio sp.]
MLIESRDIIAQSPDFLSTLSLARKVANSSSNVLITGESGSGKEVIAQYIHHLSLRKNRPFVALNCAAIPEHLLESELFGHTRGAFTGATTTKAGLFEEAEGGTLFLDEIADLDIYLQAKLLRVLQERKIKRLGDNTLRPINIRVIAATHSNLIHSVQNHKFREDLFFRLNVISINVPPLRQRKEDILPLAHYFVQKHATINNKQICGFSDSARRFLLSQMWPGNVRELENCIERAVVLATDNWVQLPDIQQTVSNATEVQMTKEQNTLSFIKSKKKDSLKILSIEEMNRLYIEYALQINNGAKEKTARDLGIDRKTLYRKLQENKST